MTWQVAIAAALEALLKGKHGVDGGLMGVGKVAQREDDRAVIDRPDFHVLGDVVFVAAFDQMDVVTAFGDGFRKGESRVSGAGDELIAVSWLMQHVGFPDFTVRAGRKLPARFWGEVVDSAGEEKLQLK